MKIVPVPHEIEDTAKSLREEEALYRNRTSIHETLLKLDPLCDKLPEGTMVDRYPDANFCNSLEVEVVGPYHITETGQQKKRLYFMKPVTDNTFMISGRSEQFPQGFHGTLKNYANTPGMLIINEDGEVELSTISISVAVDHQNDRRSHHEHTGIKLVYSDGIHQIIDRSYACIANTVTVEQAALRRLNAEVYISEIDGQQPPAKLKPNEAKALLTLHHEYGDAQVHKSALDQIAQRTELLQEFARNAVKHLLDRLEIYELETPVYGCATGPGQPSYSIRSIKFWQQTNRVYGNVFTQYSVTDSHREWKTGKELTRTTTGDRSPIDGYGIRRGELSSLHELNDAFKTLYPFFPSVIEEEKRKRLLARVEQIRKMVVDNDDYEGAIAELSPKST